MAQQFAVWGNKQPNGQRQPPARVWEDSRSLTRTCASKTGQFYEREARLDDGLT